MANGGKRVVFNTRERIISNDHNRLQGMLAKTHAVLQARLFNDRYATSLPGYASQETIGGDTPMNADVYGGLFVRVDDPTSLFIDAGVVGVVDPDSPIDLDDDPYKIIDDPGLSLGGVLTMLANSSGSARIDLVVADVVSQVLETDSRDVFDPSTGLFTPMLVNKVIAKRLSYSIIRGTPGAGMPAFTNTIVLAVACVPDGSTLWSDVTFWDVRPLVQERSDLGVRDNIDASSAFNTVAHFDHNWEMIQNAGPGSASFMVGEAWTSYLGYQAGGLLKKSTPTAAMGTGDVDLDLNDAENSTNNLVYNNTTDVGAAPVFALFPNGLPRWARYSELPVAGVGGSLRKPYGPRGILVSGRNTLSDKAKINAYGYCTNVAIPLSTGLVGTADGVCLAVLYLGNLGGAWVSNATGRGKRISFSITFNARSFVLTHAGIPADTSTDSFDYPAEFITSLTSQIPPNAVELSLQFAPATLTTDTGTAPPDPSYNDLRFNLSDNQGTVGFKVLHEEHLLGDGTSLVSALSIRTEWFRVRHRPGTTISQTISLAISGTGNWKFGTSNNAYIRGYAVP